MNANDDGTYTSPGEGWKEFIPTKENPTLEVFSPDGTKAYFLGETAEGGPRGSWLWTGKVVDMPEHIIAAVFIARQGIAGAVAAYNAWRKGDKVGKAAKTVDEVLEGAAKGKQSRSSQFSKPGGFDQANKDFDALTKGSKVTQRPGGVRTAELKDGTKVNVRPHSSTGKPTLEIQPPKGQGPPTKVRYQ